MTMFSTPKYNLEDVTFVVPIRIDSDERKANLEALLKVLNRDFNTQIIVLEADKAPLFSCELKNYDYHFVQDDDPVFHRTKYINQLFRITRTPIVAVWDADAIGIPVQIIKAVEKIRQQNAVMSFPYDGRFYSTDIAFSNLFRISLHYEIFTQNVSQLHLMFGYYSCGGAFIVNKRKYIESGGENEGFYGWGPEDAERIRRMEIFDYPVYFASGPLFHLYHPRKMYYASSEIELKNRKELLITCSHTKDSYRKIFSKKSYNTNKIIS